MAHLPSSHGDAATRGHPPKESHVSFWSLPNKGQLALLCISRIVEPLATTSIQSYMFYQLKFFDPSASASKISTQAGLLVGAKTAAQVCTGMLWGHLSDSELGGRKLVLVIGLTCAGISYLGYGLARSFPVAIFWQVFGGAMSSNVAITRCVVAELNPEKRHRARAILLLPLMSNAGMLLGPLVGGLLSSNAEDPSRTKFPYLLPNIFITSIYFIAALGIALGVKETLESLLDVEESMLCRCWSRIQNVMPGRDHKYAPLGMDEPDIPMSHLSVLSPHFPTPPRATLKSPAPIAPKKKKRLAFRRIWTFNVVCTLLGNFIINSHLGTFSSLWSIFLSTPHGSPKNQHLPFKFNGGLGMLPRDVGFAMSLVGAIGVMLQVIVYPRLQDRFGTVTIWRAALLIFPVVYVLAPFPSVVASRMHGKGPLVWMSMSGIIFLHVLARTGVTPGTTLLINDCTPHPSVRGTIHTSATVVNNLSRSIFPVAAMAIYGQGIKIGVVGLGFWCVACLAALACVVSRCVTEGTNGKEIVLSDDEED